mgnify:CR=1 FL=1
MNIALITGCNGLIGGESVEFFASKFDLVIGVDNNLRKYFFGYFAINVFIVVSLIVVSAKPGPMFTQDRLD